MTYAEHLTRCGFDLPPDAAERVRYVLRVAAGSTTLRREAMHEAIREWQAATGPLRAYWRTMLRWRIRMFRTARDATQAAMRECHREIAR